MHAYLFNIYASDISFDMFEIYNYYIKVNYSLYVLLLRLLLLPPIPYPHTTTVPRHYLYRLRHKFHENYRYLLRVDRDSTNQTCRLQTLQTAYDVNIRLYLPIFLSQYVCLYTLVSYLS